MRRALLIISLLGLPGFAGVKVPGDIGIGPMNENVWLSAFAFLQLHVRFPYEVTL